MTPPAPLENHDSRSPKSWHTCSGVLQRIGLGERLSKTPGFFDRTVTSAPVPLTEPEALSNVLPARIKSVRPMTPLEQLTLEDLIEDALLLCVASRVVCKGDRYEVTMYGDRYTLTPRQTLAFLGGAVEAHRARWRLRASRN